MLTLSSAQAQIVGSEIDLGDGGLEGAVVKAAPDWRLVDESNSTAEVMKGNNGVFCWSDPPGTVVIQF